MSKRASEFGEDSLIERIRRRLLPPSLRPGAERRGGDSLRLGIGDDAAVWRPRQGHETVLTCDWFLEGTHFLTDRHPPDSVGWKCLARAVSDVAAMGAEPRCFLLSLALPLERTRAWLDEFLRGLDAASRKLKCPAAGGDTTRQDRVLISITVVGECRQGRVVLRSGARPGDAIFATGRLGEAEYGLRLLKNGRGRSGVQGVRLRKHLYPEPRLAVGAWLAGNGLATAMMDLSDGLSSDLARLCEASKVGALIEEKRLPSVRLAKGDAGGIDPSLLALHGGDDYELLFTVAQKNVKNIPARIAGVILTRIGQITATRRIALESSSGQTRELLRRGWDPFRR